VKIPEQVTRLGIVLAALVGLILVLRFVVLPADLFSAKPHQVAATERERAKQASYAGVSVCKQCHTDEFETKSAGYHRNVACETCHGPALGHAEAPKSAKPPAPRDRKFCPVCHGYDPSRPTGFPQINQANHNPMKPCITCHDPHDPVPPETPQECSACHGQIASTKALSSHALLACTTCHEAEEQHKIQPRSSRPSKPDSREFCGQCHSSEHGVSRAPKVDMNQHGDTFLCWQCHYPHLPEGN
jgi:DnaJ-class molecular chaperone